MIQQVYSGITNLYLKPVRFLLKLLFLQEENFTIMSETKERIKCLIIGSGPAGYTAAIYAAQGRSSSSNVYRTGTGRAANHYYRS